jgi:hypothetical protein
MIVRREPQDSPWAVVVTLAKALHEQTGDPEVNRFAEMVIAANAAAGSAAGRSDSLAPTAEAAEVALRDPTPAEVAAARVVAVVASYASSELGCDDASNLVICAALYAGRFDEYQRASGR